MEKTYTDLAQWAAGEAVKNAKIHINDVDAAFLFSPEAASRATSEEIQIHVDGYTLDYPHQFNRTTDIS